MLLFAATAALIAVTPVHAIQGTAHASPYTGSIVTTRGVATRTTSNGFFLQDVRGDGNDATADGLFVYTGSVPAVIPGDEIEVTGTVVEFLPGNDTENLTVTELHPDAIRTLARGRPLPPAVAVGGDGRVPPLRVIDDDHLTDFDPGRDGIDFWESLEGMRVRLLSPRVVGPTGARGDVWVVAQDAFDTMSARGALTAMAGDEGPERIRIHDALMASPMPAFNAGDVLADVEGVVSYRFGGFEVLPHTPPTLASRGPAPETVSLPAGADRLTITTFNVYNLAATDSVRMHGIAGIVVRNLRAPAILVLQEIQDSNGAVDDGTVDAACTLGSLAAAIRHAGGPAYSAREVPPEDGADGGRPGANIRVAVMFDPARVSFVDRGFPSAGTAAVPVMTDSGLTISASPGRVQPAHPAWQAARKPLVLEFVAGGTRFFVIGCHFSSRSGTSPEFGAVQPPIDPRAAKRFAQARSYGISCRVSSSRCRSENHRGRGLQRRCLLRFAGTVVVTTALFDLMWRCPTWNATRTCTKARHTPMTASW